MALRYRFRCPLWRRCWGQSGRCRHNFETDAIGHVASLEYRRALGLALPVGTAVGWVVTTATSYRQQRDRPEKPRRSWCGGANEAGGRDGGSGGYPPSVPPVRARESHIRCTANTIHASGHDTISVSHCRPFPAIKIVAGCVHASFRAWVAARRGKRIQRAFVELGPICVALVLAQSNGPAMRRCLRSGWSGEWDGERATPRARLHHCSAVSAS
jgi:hypothetical protein